MDKFISTCHSSFLSFKKDINIMYHGSNSKDYLVYNVINNKICLALCDKFINVSDNNTFFLAHDKMFFDIIYNEDRTISVIINNKFLSASKDFTISLVDQANRWEHFNILFPDCPDIFLQEFKSYANQYENKNLKLACCCGLHNYGKEWFCTDIMPNKSNNIHYIDITKKFPFDSNILTYVYIEHGLEHVDFKGVINFLEESYRILKRGGVLRIASPSLDNWIKYYVIDNDQNDYITQYATEKWIKNAYDLNIFSKALVFNNAMRNWGHKCLLDFSTYKNILQYIGFKEIITKKIGCSEHKSLKNLETRTQFYTENETLIIEASK